MKKHFLIVCTTAILAGCSNEPKGSSDGENKTGDTAATAAIADTKSYGAVIDANGAIAMADFTKAIEGKDSLDAKVDCEIITSCAKKGCWMDVKMADGTSMKVHFKDYAFFVPTSGLTGKHAVIQGHATKEVTDVATLRHYAEDAGQSKEDCDKITQAETSWSFMADGVLIKD